MKSVKTLSRAVFAAIALSAVTPANACVAPPHCRGMDYWRINHAGDNAAGYGIGVLLSMGLNAQENAGLGPLGASAGPLGFYLPTGSWGPNGWGLSAAQNAGFPGSNFGPFSWGFNPQYTWRMNTQQNAGLIMPPFMGFGWQQPAQPQIYPVMVTYPAPAQQPQGSGVQPVQCSINQVPALTKSVDDCEKAGGDVPSATKTLREARK